MKCISICFSSLNGGSPIELYLGGAIFDDHDHSLDFLDCFGMNFPLSPTPMIISEINLIEHGATISFLHLGSVVLEIFIPHHRIVAAFRKP